MALPILEGLFTHALKFGPYTFKRKWKRGLMALFDSATLLLVRPFLDNSSLSNPPAKILIIRLDSMGDGVLSLPALEALRKQFPKAQIDFLVSPAVRPLFKSFFPEAKIHVREKNWIDKSVGALEGLWELKRQAAIFKREQYELGVDFRGDLRNILLLVLAGIPQRWARTSGGGGALLSRPLRHQSGRHEAFENLALIENQSSPEVRFPALAFEQRSFGPSDLRMTNVKGRRIVIHPGAGYPSKRWPAHKFVSLANRIVNEGLGTPIFIGAEKEQALISSTSDKLKGECINLINGTSFSELLSVISEADVFVGNDSGPAHLAALFDRRLVILFSGTNRPEEWAPWSSTMELIRHAVPCSPCEERICPLKHHACMEEIRVDQVLESVRRALR